MAESYRTTSLPSSGDLSTKEGYAIKVDTSGYAAVQASAGAAYSGVLVANPVLPSSSSQTASIALRGGRVKVVAGAAVSKGDLLGLDSSGRFVTYASGQYAGQAIEAATAAGQLIDAITF